MKEEVILKVKNVNKSFPGVRALNNVDFELRRGEIHALVGENGAGKSTLIKILCGVYKEDSGSMFLNGEKLKIGNVGDARNNGITFVPQEIEMMENLNVSENIYVGKYPSKFGFINWRKLKEKTDQIKKLFGGVITELNNEVLVGDLSIANKQLIEILKILAFEMKIVCFDEPTSSLTLEETERLFELLLKLKKQGISIIYVSHRLEEIFKIADRVTVFKDGRHIMTSNINDVNIEEVANSMVGRELNNLKKIDRSSKISEENVLEVKNLNSDGKFKDINFKLNKGEILGWFGLIGSGRSEVAESLFGISEVDSGEIRIFGRKVDINSPSKAIIHKIGLAPEDRHKQGLILSMQVKENINLSVYNKVTKYGFIKRKEEINNAKKMVKDLNIKTPSINTIVDGLSGGNKQKVSIAKWLNAKSKILIFDEPTKGIDVGSKNEIYRLMRILADEGNSIIFISSELQEIINLSDRIIVFKERKIAKELKNYADLQEKDVFKYAIISKKE